MRGHRGRLLAGDETLFDRVKVFLEKPERGEGLFVTVTVPWERVGALRRVNRIVIAGGRTCDLDLHRIDNDAVKNESVGTFLSRYNPLERDEPS